MSNGQGLRCAVLLGALSALPAIAHANINLEFRVAATTVRVGDTVDVGLYAVSDDATNQTFSAVEVILNWDPNVLRFDGKIDNGFTWTLSFFPCDGCPPFDRLNFECCCSQTVCDPPYSGTPANDGDAFFNALQFVSPTPFPQATPEGLLITTFVFTAIARAASTTITMPASFSINTETSVLHATPDAGQFSLTGTLGSLSLTVAACGTRGDFDGNCLVQLFPDQSDFASCMNGPDGAPLSPACEPADFNGDGVADMRDAAAFQREFTGP